MKCSPKIWSKFSPTEQDEWTNFNKIILWNLKNAELLKEIPKENLEILAHNIACEHIWEIRILLNLPNHKGLREKFYLKSFGT